MSTIIEATYRNGTLILGRRLEHLGEGEKVRVIIADDVSREAARARFWRSVDENRIQIPPDYRFVREALYER